MDKSCSRSDGCSIAWNCKLTFISIPVSHVIFTALFGHRLMWCLTLGCLSFFLGKPNPYIRVEFLTTSNTQLLSFVNILWLFKDTRNFHASKAAAIFCAVSSVTLNDVREMVEWGSRIPTYLLPNVSSKWSPRAQCLCFHASVSASVRFKHFQTVVPVSHQKDHLLLFFRIARCSSKRS